MKMIFGTELHSDDRKHVLAAFVHRFTGDHKPQWASGVWKDGKPYPLQFADDADWLSNTRFPCREDGRLDARFTHCESRSTWPNNPELRS